MNAMGHVQSKWHSIFAHDPLRLYVNEYQKNKIVITLGIFSINLSHPVLMQFTINDCLKFYQLCLFTKKEQLQCHC